MGVIDHVQINDRSRAAAARDAVAGVGLVIGAAALMYVPFEALFGHGLIAAIIAAMLMIPEGTDVAVLGLHPYESLRARTRRPTRARAASPELAHGWSFSQQTILRRPISPRRQADGRIRSILPGKPRRAISTPRTEHSPQRPAITRPTGVPDHAIG